MDVWKDGGGVCKWKNKKGDPRSTERICAYASGKFSPIKSAIDAELHAVLKTLEALKIYYLDKREILIRTDCQAIISFFNKSAQNKPSRVRWMTFIDYITGSGVEVQFEHIEGTSNILTDSLSRLINILLNAGWREEQKDQLSLLAEATQELKAKPNPKAEAFLNQIACKIIASYSSTLMSSPAFKKERKGYLMTKTPQKERSESYSRRQQNKQSMPYNNTETSTHLKWKSTGGEAQEKTTGIKTGYQLSSSNNNSWKEPWRLQKTPPKGRQTSASRDTVDP